jgi:hypothetical protein
MQQPVIISDSANAPPETSVGQTLTNPSSESPLSQHTLNPDSSATPQLEVSTSRNSPTLPQSGGPESAPDDSSPLVQEIRSEVSKTLSIPPVW